MVKAKLNSIKSGERKHASHKTVNEWVKYAWKHVATNKCIFDGFCQCGYFDFDGSVDKLHSQRSDTIKNVFLNTAKPV